MERAGGREEGVLARKGAEQAETARRPKAVGGQGTSGGQEISKTRGNEGGGK